MSDFPMAAKHVLAISASRQRRNTYSLLTQARELLREHGIDVEIINLYDFEISDCLGCLRCLEHGEQCGQQDDYPELLERMRTSDGLILGTPVHMASISGKLKTLIDRMFVQVHRPELAGLPLLTVATTGGSGLKRVRSYLNEAATMMGMYPCGSIGRRAPQMAEPVTERELARFVDAVLSGREAHRPSLRQVTFFHVAKAMALTFIDLDREFWIRERLDRAPYYYPCRMGPIARVYGGMVGAFMLRAMRRFS